MARGLKSIEDARELRKTRRYGTPSPMFVVALAGSALAALIFYAVKSERDLESGKKQLLSERAAAMVTVGTEWQKLKSELENDVVAAGKADWSQDFIGPELRGRSLAERPAIYVRLRLSEARSVESFREAMQESTRDGFTSCFFRQRNDVPAHSALAGVADAGHLLEQPWHLRQGLQATRVFDESWATDLRNAGDDLRLRAFQRDYEHAKKIEIPLAIDITKRSEYFVFLLDEDPDGVPIQGADGGRATLEDVEKVPHPVRVHVVQLGKHRKPVLAMRRVAQGEFRMMGLGGDMPPDTEAAMRRQVNNCALANAIKGELEPKP